MWKNKKVNFIENQKYCLRKLICIKKSYEWDWIRNLKLKKRIEDKSRKVQKLRKILLLRDWHLLLGL